MIENINAVKKLIERSFYHKVTFWNRCILPSLKSPEEISYAFPTKRRAFSAVTWLYWSTALSAFCWRYFILKCWRYDAASEICPVELAFLQKSISTIIIHLSVTFIWPKHSSEKANSKLLRVEANNFWLKHKTAETMRKFRTAIPISWTVVGPHLPSKSSKIARSQSEVLKLSRVDPKEIIEKPIFSISVESLFPRLVNI